MSKYIGRESKADIRERRTGMRQSVGAMIVKIVFGVLFIVVGAEGSPGQDRVSFFFTGLCVGLALIAWSVIPYLKARKNRQLRNEAIESLNMENYKNSPLYPNSNKTFADEEAEKLAQKYEDPELRI